MSPTARIGITLGDPSGIGPEIVARALAEAGEAIARRAVVFGDRAVFDRAAEAASVSARPDLVDCGVIADEVLDRDAIPGRPAPRGGEAQVAYLDAAVQAARAGSIDAIVTAPINKRQVREAGFSFPGHTEFLADRLGADDVAMMFAGPRLRVALATVHLPLARVPRELSGERIRSVTRLLAGALRRDFGVPTPRIGILGLNPHAGEDGLFGREDADVVAPAVRDLATALGPEVAVTGPLVPDAAFRGALRDPGGAPPPAFDALVALYHDQGLIPVKLVDFDLAVNVTLGLPVVRTSPDHGVAYDIAGTGRARHDSFRAALDLADHLAHRRAANSHPRPSSTRFR